MAPVPVSVASGSPGYSGGTTSMPSGEGVPPVASSATPGSPAATVGAPVSQDAIQKAVAAANSALAQSGTELNFVFDKQANDMIVKVVDTQTRQVVQQFPAQWMTAAARALSDATPGALVNTNA